MVKTVAMPSFPGLEKRRLLFDLSPEVRVEVMMRHERLEWFC
jgi:hypothetical protein